MRPIQEIYTDHILNITKYILNKAKTSFSLPSQVPIH